MDAQRAHGIRRLHSLSGVVPLGVFLVEHLWAVSGAIRGRAAFDARVIWLDGVRFGSVLEILFIGLPLAFHAVYGVVLAFDKKQNPDLYPYKDQRFAFLLRATGVLSLLFIAWHVWELPLQRLLTKIPASDLYDLLVMHLSTTTRGVPWRAIGYFLGLFVTLAHFTYGMISFSFNERNIREELPLRRSMFRWVALGGILFLVGSATILSMATGWPAFAPKSPVPQVSCP
jgi:succinate dehydrogenase / fumarate reductase cytochrome b subunit